MTSTITIKSSATDASQVSLAAEPGSWLLHVGQSSIHQDVRQVTAVHVAPLLTLLTRDLGLEIVGGPPLDPDTFTDQKRYGWKLLAAAGDLDIIVSMFVEAPEARMTPSGSLIVEPSNYPAYVGISVAGKYAHGRTFRENGSYRAHDVVAALTTLFPLTITDPRNVLTRHLRDAPPAFEVFDDGTTAPLTAGDVRLTRSQKSWSSPASPHRRSAGCSAAAGCHPASARHNSGRPTCSPLLLRLRRIPVPHAPGSAAGRRCASPTFAERYRPPRPPGHRLLMSDLIDAQEMGDRIAKRIVDLGNTAVVPHVLAATGLTDSELVDVVEGRHPLSSLTLYELADALRTTPMYLVTGETDGMRIIVCTDVLGELS